MAWIYDPVWSGSDGLGMAWHGKVLLERFRYGLLRKAEVGSGEVGFSQ